MKRRKKYEKRLRESFKSAVEGYFQQVGNYFDLENKTKITRPIDVDLVKPLVRKTVQSWSFEKIVELDYGILDSLATKKYFASKVKYLKEKLPQFEQFNLPYKP